MWWDTHTINWNGKSLLKKEVDISDASLTGWGATSQNQRTGGPWSQTEHRIHKLSGAASCNTSSQDIPAEHNQDISTPQVRQHHGSNIYKQPGRNSLQGIVDLDLDILRNKTRILVLLRLDNTTAVTYTNNLGGTVSKELVDLDTETKSFRRKLPYSCSSPGGLSLTTHSLASGIAGVVQEVQIPFQAL